MSPAGGAHPPARSPSRCGAGIKVVRLVEEEGSSTIFTNDLAAAFESGITASLEEQGITLWLRPRRAAAVRS